MLHLQAAYLPQGKTGWPTTYHMESHLLVQELKELTENRYSMDTEVQT